MNKMFIEDDSLIPITLINIRKTMIPMEVAVPATGSFSTGQK